MPSLIRHATSDMSNGSLDSTSTGRATSNSKPERQWAEHAQHALKELQSTYEQLINDLERNGDTAASASTSTSDKQNASTLKASKAAREYGYKADPSPHWSTGSGKP